MIKPRRFIVNLINKTLGHFGLQIKVADTGFWDLDSEFLNIYEKIRSRTLVKIDRCYMLYQFAKHASLIPQGDVAQVGVYKGGTAKMIATCFSKTNKKFYLFDTFEGLPAKSDKDEINLKRVNDVKKSFGDVDVEDIKKYFTDFPNIEIKKGYFPNTTSGLEDGKFCFVYLDADLYQSTKDGLNFFYPRMVPGGIIMFDDFKTNNWPGVERAVREFKNEQKISSITTTWWQGLIVCGAPKA